MTRTAVSWDAHGRRLAVRCPACGATVWVMRANVSQDGRVDHVLECADDECREVFWALLISFVPQLPGSKIGKE